MSVKKIHTDLATGFVDIHDFSFNNKKTVLGIMKLNGITYSDHIALLIMTQIISDC